MFGKVFGFVITSPPQTTILQMSQKRANGTQHNTLFPKIIFQVALHPRENFQPHSEPQTHEETTRGGTIMIIGRGTIINKKRKYTIPQVLQGWEGN